MRRRVLGILAAAALVVSAFAGCGGARDGSVRFSADDAWARATPPGASNGVVYLTLTVPRADHLVRVSVPPSIAAAAMLHATTGAGGGAAGHVHGSGDGDASSEAGASPMVGMEALASVRLEAGTPFLFVPGGAHVMLMGLAGPLVAGTRFPLTLQFARERDRQVSVEVRDNPPGSGP